MNGTPRVAVIGTGRWGMNLVRNFHALGALAAAVESNKNIQATLRKDYPDLQVYLDFDPILESKDIQAVAIATPVPTHYEIAKTCLEFGKDVFVEKPMTLKTAEAQELVDIAERHERILMTGHLLLFQPAIQFIKKAIKEKLIGDLKSLHQERLNLGTARSVENALWSLGVHDVAILLDLVDEVPEHVTTTGQSILQSAIEDDVYLHMEFANGIYAHLHNSWLWPERRRQLTVIGTTGMLVYDELAQTVTHHKKSIDSKLKNQDHGSEVVFQETGDPLKVEVQHFLDCVSSRSAPRTSGRSGIEVIRVLERASERLREKEHTHA